MGDFHEQREEKRVVSALGWSRLPLLRRRTTLRRARTPVQVPVAGRTGPPALGPEAPELEAAQDPRNPSYRPY